MAPPFDGPERQHDPILGNAGLEQLRRDAVLDPIPLKHGFKLRKRCFHPLRDLDGVRAVLLRNYKLDPRLTFDGRTSDSRFEAISPPALVIAGPARSAVTRQSIGRAAPSALQ